MARKIPLGVSIISILVLLSGLLGVIIGILGIVGFVGLTATGAGVIGVFALIIGIILLTIGVIKVIIFFSLRKGKQWARAVIIILESITLLSGIVALFTAFTVMTLIQVLIAGVIIWYLGFSKTARRFFD